MSTSKIDYSILPIAVRVYPLVSEEEEEQKKKEDDIVILETPPPSLKHKKPSEGEAFVSRAEFDAMNSKMDMILAAVNHLQPVTPSIEDWEQKLNVLVAEKLKHSQLEIHEKWEEITKTYLTRIDEICAAQSCGNALNRRRNPQWSCKRSW